MYVCVCTLKITGKIYTRTLATISLSGKGLCFYVFSRVSAMNVIILSYFPMISNVKFLVIECHPRKGRRGRGGERKEKTGFITDEARLISPSAPQEKTNLHKSNPSFPRLLFASLLVLLLLLAISFFIAFISKYPTESIRNVCLP